MHLRLCSPTVKDSLASASFRPLLLNKDKCVTDSPPPPVCGRLIFPCSVRTDYYNDYLAERRSKQGVAAALQDLFSSCFILHDRRRVLKSSTASRTWCRGRLRGHNPWFKWYTLYFPESWAALGHSPLPLPRSLWVGAESCISRIHSPDTSVR